MGTLWQRLAVTISAQELYFAGVFAFLIVLNIAYWGRWWSLTKEERAHEREEERRDYDRWWW